MMQAMSTALTGLLSHQRAVDVTSNNIANANTEGYSKQRVNFSTNFSVDRGNYHVGTGVNIQSVSRSHDEMLWSNLKNASNSNSSYQEYANHMNQVKDTLMGSGLDGNNITDMVNEWFSSLQNLADNPNSEEIRADVQIGAQDIRDRATQLNGTLNDYKSTLEQQRELLVTEANTYLEQIDKINEQIFRVEAGNENTTRKDYANELRDQRDLLEKKLNDIGNFRVIKDNVSTTGTHNNTDWGLKYQYEFDEKGGRLAGIDKSMESIQNLQDGFNSKMFPLTQKMDEFFAADMQNPNDVIQWNYDNDPSSDIAGEYIMFSSKTDSANSFASSSQATVDTFQNRYDASTKVNLDEELLNMMRFQRAYEANVKVIQTADAMLGTIINMKA